MLSILPRLNFKSLLKMNCLKPTLLKNGLAVPCGKCELCRSDARNEWSIRLAIHLQNCDRMPMFITLTYDDKHLPLVDGYPTLKRDDVSKFLKAYKRKYCLRNEDFQYFGCGEYGENFRRPHYHLLFFGDFQLYDAFFCSTEVAQNRISSLWDKGFVHVCLAGYDGIHYVTKYCLKDDIDLIPEVVKKPFTIASNGLGMNFLNSYDGLYYRKKLVYMMAHKDEILRNTPALNDDFGNFEEVFSYWLRFVPTFTTVLDDGRTVFLPRAIRRRLVGSFEHFKDSPLWYYHHIGELAKSVNYYSKFADYDKNSDVNMSLQLCLNRLEKIRKRLLEKKYNSKNKLL